MSIKNVFVCLVLLISLTFFKIAFSNEENYQKDLLNHSYKINQSVTEIEYFIDEYTRLPKARITERITFQRINGVNPFEISCSYDDENILFEEMSFKAVEGPKSKPAVISGTYSEEGVFHSDLKFKTYSFRLKKNGDITTVILKKVVNDIRYLANKIFHDFYPINKLDFSITIPDAFKVKLLVRNLEHWNTKMDTVRNEGEITYGFSINHLESISFFEDDVTILQQDYYPLIYTIPEYFKIDEREELFFNNLGNYYKWVYHFIDMLKPDTAFIDSIYNEIVPSELTKEQKLKFILNWVQDNVRYIAFEKGINGFKPDEAQSVFQKKYADCKGKANLCIEFLKRAGFDAHFVWVNTDYSPYSHYDAPGLSIDNHVICAIFEDGRYRYLDPTDVYSTVDALPFYLFNKEVLVENGQDFELDTIKPLPNQFEGLERTIVFDSIDSNNTLHGNFVMKFEGSLKAFVFNFLNQVRKAEYDDVFDFLLQTDSKITVKEFKTTEPFVKVKPFIIEGTLAFKNAVKNFGKTRKFISQFPYDDLRYLRWVKDAEVPVLLPWYINMKDDISINIGRSCEFQQDIKPVKISNDFLDFDFSITKTDSVLKINRELSIKSLTIRLEDLTEFNKSTKIVIDNSEKYLILKNK